MAQALDTPIILTSDPPAGTIPYGEVVYVDDGSDPGYLEKIVGGNQSKGIPRSVTIVPDFRIPTTDPSSEAPTPVATTPTITSTSSIVSIEAPSQTANLQPFTIVENNHQAGTSFVFSPGDGLDVVSGFKIGGTGHDTLDMPSSDFRNFAAVLHNIGDIQGSAFITDPKTGDAIRLASVTTAELKAHPKDFSFV